MSEQILVKHCAPTLAGIKTGNLFNFWFDSQGELKEIIKQWNSQLNFKGVYVEALKASNGRALIYVYREKMLEKDICEGRAKSFLFNYGYRDFSVGNCISTLKSRIAGSDEFPHEIGLFLGYPLEDVIGFIENAGENSKCVGCWKVYCNECEAIKLFARFKRCKEVYTRLFNNGRSIEQLAIAV